MELDPSLILARWVYYCAATVLFGSSLFPLYAGLNAGASNRAIPRAAATVLAVAALVAAILWLLCFAAAIGEPEDLVETTRAVLFDSGFGPAWLVRLSGTCLALWAALVGRTRLIVGAMLIALACEGWSGHAAAWGLAGSVAQAIHVICAAAWIGGLLPLALLVQQAGKDRLDVALAVMALRRFSRYGMVIVAGIALAGAANTWMILGWPDPARPYGRVLLAKLALFAVMLIFAAWNRCLVPRLRGQGGRHAMLTITRNIIVEQVVAAAVLLAVSALGLMNPQRW